MVGNNAVMTGEGQVVQLDVRTEDDALSDGIHRSGTVERLGEGCACPVLAADLAIPLAAMVADTDRIAAISLEAQARPKTKLHAANLGRL